MGLGLLGHQINGAESQCCTCFGVQVRVQASAQNRSFQFGVWDLMHTGVGLPCVRLFRGYGGLLGPHNGESNKHELEDDIYPFAVIMLQTDNSSFKDGRAR